MKRIVLRVKDEVKSRTLLHLLRELDFIEVEEENTQAEDVDEGALADAFGLWKDCDESVATIREKAWGM